jgi:hypothetical protein
VPLWVKQVIYLKLAEEMRSYYCEDFLRTHLQDDIFSTFVPTLTFKGKTELSEKTCGFDNNTYNFLRCCSEGLSMLEISVNTFLSMEEVAKYYQLCLEQGYIKISNSPEIDAMADYISGKIRIGEYFKQNGTISIEQLEKALSDYQAATDKKFGEILIEFGYVTEKDLKSILVLKDEAKKRFILDYSAMPKSETTFSDNEQKYQDEIKALKGENFKLKQKLLQLLKLVKNNA